MHQTRCSSVESLPLRPFPQKWSENENIFYIHRVKKIFQPFRQPFPESDSISDMLRSSAVIGFFITFFLYAFRPFGLDTYPGNLLLLTLGFGLIAAGMGLALDLVVRYVLGQRKDMPSWTLGKWVIQVMVLVLCIGVANYFFMGWTSDNVWRSWIALGIMLRNTFLIGIFPTLILGFWVQMNALRKNVNEAQKLREAMHEHPQNEAAIELSSQNDSTILTLLVSEIYYAEAMQNYVAIYHKRDGKMERSLFRSTIQALALQLARTPIIRCHRSYLVNTDCIEQVNGNAQGLRLTLHQVPGIEIPVSRSYIPVLKSILA